MGAFDMKARQNSLSKEMKEIRVVGRQEENYRNTIAGIVYEMHVIGDCTVGDDVDKGIIAETLQKLPKKVREDVLDDVHFVIMGEAYGTVRDCRFLKGIPKKEIDKLTLPSLSVTMVHIDVSFIILNLGKMRSRQEKMDTVAHEIAHYWLDHHHNLCDNHNERNADDLAVKWGFNRSYKEYPDEWKVVKK